MSDFEQTDAMSSPNSDVGSGSGSGGATGTWMSGQVNVAPPSRTPDASVSASAEERNPVDALADEYSMRLRKGESPSIDEFVQRLPEYEAAIRSLFPSVAMMERISKKDHAEHQIVQQAVRLTDSIPQVLGDFRIVREIGRGGMGIVYEAEQQSLRRRVALKIVSPLAAVSDNQIVRFRREAEAAAGLHHTNIVPVFGIGEADGVHYFAMQLIDGVPLSEFIQSTRTDVCETTQHQGQGNDTSGDQPSASFEFNPVDISGATRVDPPTEVKTFPTCQNHQTSSGTARPEHSDSLVDEGGRQASVHHFRKVAAMVRDVASALSYAHSHGVLHRDVKPSNLLLDLEGRVWVTDFGLARREDHEDVTRTGDLVGTLRYMAPEQFDGQTDSRSDICSLGLTLYELLTLTPACTETRHGLVIKARTESPPPSPRSANPSIHVDLDTIVQKAAALAPADRYQDAAELADDLQRFLDDRPISARRMRWDERLQRWARRNPAIAGLSTTAAILLVAVAVTFAVGQRRAQAAHGDAQQAQQAALAALAIAETERSRATGNLNLAIEAFEQIIDRIASRGVSPSLAVTDGEEEVALSESVLTDGDVELLESLLHFFDRFATENDSGTTLADSVAARKRVADIQQRLGRFDEATATYQRSRQAYAKLATDNPDELKYVIAQADILNEMGISASRRAEIDEAIELHTAARSLLENDQRLLTTEPGRFELARTLTLYSSIGQRAGLWTLFGKGRRGGSPSSRPREELSTYRSPLGRHRGDRRGSGPSNRGDSGGGTEPRHRGVDRNNDDSHPRVSFMRGNNRGGGNTRVPETATACQSAIRLLNELIADVPHNTTYRLWLARAYRAESGLWLSSRDKELTAASLQLAVAELERLTVEHPDVPELLYELADMLCLPLSATADPQTRAQSMTNVQRAIDLCEDLAGAYPNSQEYQSLLGTALSQLASLRMDAGDSESATELWHSALYLQRSLAERFPAVTIYRIACAQSLQQLAEAEHRTGLDSLARDHLDEAIAVVQETELPEDVAKFMDRFAVRLQQRRTDISDR
jgi:eukaryotic-like serine/threonine-protein kinase